MENVFDGYAKEYDKSFTNSPIGRLQRNRVYYFLKGSFGLNQLSVLEINCGTGEDAIWLANHSHSIVATDAAGEMIDVCRNKIATQNLEKSIQFIHASFSELKNVLGERKFDLIFSNFGGLNCVSPEELLKLAADFALLLKPNGKLIAVVMGRKCLWERMYFSLKGKFSEAKRRNSKDKLEVKIGDSTVSTWYYSPAEFSRLFSLRFQTIKTKPIGLFIPPSYLNPFFKNKKWLFNILDFVEGTFPFSFLSNYADHFFIELKKY